MYNLTSYLEHTETDKRNYAVNIYPIISLGDGLESLPDDLKVEYLLSLINYRIYHEYINC